MLLQAVVLILSLTGYPAFAWWVGVRYEKRGLLVLWLALSALLVGFMMFRMRGLELGYSPLTALAGASYSIFALGLCTRSIHQSLKQFGDDAPPMIPLGAVGKAVLWYFLGTIMGALVAIILINPEF